MGHVRDWDCIVQVIPSSWLIGFNVIFNSERSYRTTSSTPNPCKLMNHLRRLHQLTMYLDSNSLPSPNMENEFQATIRYQPVMHLVTPLMCFSANGHNRVVIKTTWWARHGSPQNTWLQIDHMHRLTQFENSNRQFPMQHQILIEEHYIHSLYAEFVVKHTHPIIAHHAEIRNMIFAHGSGPIYSTPTYIMAPFLGPHQPWHI